MYRKLFLFFILLSLTAQIGFSQILKDEKKDEELKKEAAVFLRETAIDVGNLRTLGNRVSFSAEIANLMWFHDEKEAQALFQKVIVDFRQLLIQLDGQFTALDKAASEETESFEGAMTKSRLQRKFRSVIGARQQIALSIAEHDPQMAYDFFNGTAQAVANPELLKQFADADIYFELRLINAIAEKDIDKALEAGRKRLAKGFNFELVSLLKKVYEKDADKGIAFGEEIISKVKSDNAKSINLYLLSSLLAMGAENLDKIKDKPGKKPIFSEQSMREIADLMAQEILKADNNAKDFAAGYISQIERFSPSRAAQIRQKFALNNTNRTEVRTIASTDGDEQLISTVQTRVENSQSQDGFYKDMASLGGKKLSKEEIEKVVKSARETISKIKSREQKLTALSVLAAQISFAGDKELAAEIMSEARNLVNLQPKNYKDFLLVWMLASGYTASDADKAFPIIEDAILRLNDTIAAFIKIGEFIDADGEIMEGDEVQVGSFGGSMTRELLGSLGASNPTIRGLAMTDFARTKALTNKFDRTEVRILAKMLVLRAILGDKKIVAEN